VPKLGRVFAGATMAIAVCCVPVQAGAPKSQFVTAIHVARGVVRADAFVAEQSVTMPLAGISAPDRFRTGVHCASRTTARLQTRAARTLHLDVSAVFSDDRGASYIMQPASTGTHTTVRSSFNVYLVRRGLARVRTGRWAARPALQSAQRSARRAHRGIWGCRH
jgi:endonuclease YncB( thermonuclease family)